MEKKTTTETMQVKATEQAIKVNGKVLTVTKVSAEGEQVQGTFEFMAHEKVKVVCAKVKDSTKVVCTVKVNNKDAATGLSAQGMFQVVEQLTGIKADKINAMYKKASPFRKEGGSGKVTTIVDTAKLEDVKL